MIEIKYVNPDRSKLFEEINAKFIEPGDKPVNIELSSSSKYSGNFEVEIGSDQGSFKVDGFKNKDETRFPQRIKVLASILRNRGLRGVYQLTTQSNILTMLKRTIEISHSWKRFGDNILLKNLDISSFKYGGSAIPRDFYDFFLIPVETLDMEVKLLCRREVFDAKITTTREKSPVRRIWFNSILDILKNEFKNWEQISPRTKSDFYLSFQKTDKKNQYALEFINKKTGNSTLNGFNETSLMERLNLWEKIQKLPDGEVDPSYIRELKIYKGATGICRDDTGVCISVLNTGKHYPDDIFEDGILYHYPNTPKRSKSFDINETNSVKACKSLGLPLFVILPGNNPKKRTIRLGWVEDYDDVGEQFLIKFGENQPGPLQEIEGTEFIPRTKRRKRSREVDTRSNNQTKFRFDVFIRYGAKCAVCNVDNKHMLDAAHIIPVDDDGTDDPRNGLVLCKNHHAALDRDLFSVNLDDFSIVAKDRSINIMEKKLNTQTGKFPHLNALRQRFKT